MEPQTNTQKTVMIAIISVVAIIILIVAGIYMFRHQIPATNQEFPASTASSTASSTYNLGEDKNTVSLEEKAAVDAYARAHINQISKRKARAGSSFRVTTVTIEAPGRAIVEYTDGVTTYDGAANYSVDASGNVVFSSFDVLEK